jgi:ketosteroid isomerase-like protein
MVRCVEELERGPVVSKKVSLCLLMVTLLASSAIFAAHHEAEYEKLADNWEMAYNTAGAAAVAALYLEDGMRMPPDMPIAEGRAAIAAQVQAGMDQGQVKVDIEMVESMVSGELGVARGTFKGIDAEGNTMTAGKWMSISKWVDGKWQIHADIWNMDAPMAMAE